MATVTKDCTSENVDQICKFAAQETNSGIAACREYRRFEQKFTLEGKPYFNRDEFREEPDFELCKDKDNECYRDSSSVCVWGVNDDVSSNQTSHNDKQLNFLNWASRKAYFPLFGSDCEHLVVVFRKAMDAEFDRQKVIVSWLATQLRLSLSNNSSDREPLHNAVVSLDRAFKASETNDRWLTELCRDWPAGDITFYILPRSETVALAISEDGEEQVFDESFLRIQDSLTAIDRSSEFPVVQYCDSFAGVSEPRLLCHAASTEDATVWLSSSVFEPQLEIAGNCLLTLVAALTGVAITASSPADES